MLLSAKAARKQPCPIARVGREVKGSCDSDICMFWRLHKSSTDAAWLEAMRKAKEETGEKGAAPKAAALVVDNPGKYGLPTGDDRLGYCGLAGPVEVTG